MKTADLAALVSACLSVTGAVQWRSPSVEALPWQIDLGETCDRLVDSALDGTGMRATLSAPARHGKTEWTGRGMPIRAFLGAWMRGLCVLDSPKPTFSIFYVTSAGDRSGEVSDQIRSAVARIYRETGDELWAPGPTWKREDFQTRGGLRWVACGWSATTGGVGANLLIMDDMTGSSEVYRGPTQRNKIRRVVQEDLLSRLVEGGAALQMETRRGIHDTTAWLLGDFPDVWEDHTWKCYDPERGYLWPEQYGEKWRKTMPHLTDNSPVWRSLYQQEPIAEGGTIIDPSWLEATYSEPPDVVASLADLRVFGVDLASTGKQTSDPCAFVVVAVRDAFVDVLFAYQKQMDYPRARQYLTELGLEWDTHGGVVELAANGDALVADLSSVVAGIRGERATKDKVARLTPWLPMMAARQLRLPAMGAPWVRSFREAVLAFSGTDGDDDHFIDALVWALVAADTGTGQMTVDDWADVF